MSYVVENLPNVFIKSILLDNIQESNSSYKIAVEVSVNVMNTDSRWIDDDFMVKHLNVVLIKSSNETFNRRVTSGEIMITGDTIKEHLSLEPDRDIVFRQLPVSPKKMMIHKNNSAIFNFEFLQTHETPDLRLFAMASVNMSELCVQYGGDPMTGDMAVYNGPVISESIIRNNIPVRSASLFLLGGSPYYGPVHAHAGGYMVGSQHSSRSHPKLTVAEVPNLKLKDNRTVSYSSINSISSQIKDRPLFSELYTTFGSNSTLKGIFSINIEQMLLSKTKHGKSFFNLRRDQYEKLLSSFYIKSIKLYKKTVRSGKKSRKVSKVLKRDMIAETKDEQNSNSLISMIRMKQKSVSHGQESTINVPTTSVGEYNLQDYRHISTLKEEMIFNKNRIRTFSFVDTQISSRDNTEYCYEVKIEFIDATVKMVRDMMNRINQSISKLERYIYLSGLHKNYDFSLNKLKPAYIDSLITDFVDVSSAPWIEAPTTYSEHLSILNDISVIQQQREARKNSSFLIPETFDIKSSKLFLKKYKELAQQFMIKFNLSTSDIQGKTSQRSQKVFQNKNSSDILVQTTFGEIVKTSEIDLGYEIFDFEEGMELSTISKDTFDTMVTNDNNKFFEGRVDLTKEEKEALTEEEYLAYQDYRTYRPSYLSIKSVKRGKNTIRASFESPAKLDHKLLSSFSKTKVNLFTKKFTRKKLSIDTINKSEAADVDFVKAENYFGTDSSFVTSDFLVEETVPPSSYSMQPAFFNTQLVAGVMPHHSGSSISSFDILQQTGLPDPMFYKNMPNQIKAIFGSRSNSSKNNFLDSDVDVLSMPQTSDSAAMMFLTLQRVMYCQGFAPQPNPQTSANLPDTDKLSLRQIKKPIWKILDQNALDTLTGPTLCKTEYYEPSGMNMSIAQENKFNVYNNLFIIDFPPSEVVSKDIVMTNKLLQDNYSLIQNPEYVEYSTTNIVLQPHGPAAETGTAPSTSPAATGMATGAGMGGGMSSGGGGMSSGGGGYGY